ncbi:hypothetical protein AK830_g10521 [Neonectria ditissima]|uniref:Rhodopsin domain-containing protein n=1 Tax=Neonectria ditissima TaxID=78410 RepID=A0A0P7B606_9HYPO|nr:hypothetical protein AK830_g10521 [Neonectria ditissima]
MANEELWGEYAVGALIIVMRFFARWKVVGLRNFAIEDLFMLTALLSYTAVTVVIHEITVHGSTIGQTSESVYLLTDEQITNFTIGQKLTFADWLIYLIYVWSLKATLLTMFSRLAKNLPTEELILKIVLGYTGVAFIGAVLSHIYACALRNLNYYLVSFFNASSDLAIIAVPVPIIFKAKIPVWRRLMLLALLCSGVFVIIATILRAYYSLKSITTLPVAAGWTSRETFVAAIAVSIPGIKPLFSRSKWFRFRSTAEDVVYYTGSRGKNGNHELQTIGGGRQPATCGPEEVGQSEWQVSGKELKGTRLSSDGSEDIILSGGNEQSHVSSIDVTRDHTRSSEQKASLKYT